MIDSRMVGVPFNEPTLWTARFKGAGTNSIPTAVANTSQRVFISTYSNVGAMVVTLADNGPGVAGGTVGVVQAYEFKYASSLIGGANAKQIIVTPPTVNTATFTLQVQFANGTATDLATTDELVCVVWTSRSIKP
jgi:hypothetical protein